MAHTKNVVDDRVGDDDMHSKSFPKKEGEGFTSSRAKKPLQRKSVVGTIWKKKAKPKEVPPSRRSPSNPSSRVLRSRKRSKLP
jgi:hypothetical protein